MPACFRSSLTRVLVALFLADRFPVALVFFPERFVARFVREDVFVFFLGDEYFT